jgi:hypothetical protein
MAEMTKFVLNDCYGGFGLSEDAMRLYAQKKGIPFYIWRDQSSRHLTKLYFTADPTGMSKIDGDFYEKYLLCDQTIERNDPVLVEVVEELGDKANGDCARLYIEELPKGTQYHIKEYDGKEWIETSSDNIWKIA